MELMQAHNQWASRPDDERYTSLTDMLAHFQQERAQSRQVVASSRKIEIVAHDDHKGLGVMGGAGVEYAPTNWAFGQLAQLAESPASYLRTLPAELAADCLNYGLKFKRDIEDVGLLLYKNGASMLKAATGPKYGRIWNADVVAALVSKFGDGVSGDWCVPAEFGRKAPITKENTTLYAGDRDMWVFLADENHKVEIPNRRNGQPGLLSRGFFMGNSEVGKSTFFIGTFLFDYMCGNHIIWGAEGFQEVRIRHTASAPDRFLEEVHPALTTYANSSTGGIVTLIEDARSKRLDNVDEFLAGRFGKRTVDTLKAIHMLEEGRPIETLWDVSTAVTAQARSVKHIDARVELERQAGEVLKLAA